MDVRLSSLLPLASVVILLAGCSYAPTHTDAKPTYTAPKPVSTAPPLTREDAHSTSASANTAVSKQKTTAEKATTPSIPGAKPYVPEVAPKPAKKQKIKPAPIKSKPAPASTPALKPQTEPSIAVATPKVEPPKMAATAAFPATDEGKPAPTVETIAVALNKMPITIHDQWILDRTETRCNLMSTTIKMDDGQGGTPVTFSLTPDSLSFNTKSDIDLSYKGTGLSIDDDKPFALETVDLNTNLSFSKQRQAILSSMKSGQSMQLTLGFWPTWPVTHTYSVTLSLEHFATAVRAWETCNQLLSHK